MKLTFFLITLVYAQYRSYDGTGNNVQNPSYGSVNSPYVRDKSNASYDDGVSTPAGPNRPSPLQISNLLFKDQGRVVSNPLKMSDLVPYLGQFLAYDLMMTANDNNATALNIPLPPCLSDSTPCDGISQPITMKRAATGGLVNGVRGILNSQTAFVDASHIYGNSSARAGQLRQPGYAYFKTQLNGKLLAVTSGASSQAMDGTDIRRFLAGDPRANQNPALQALHTLFMREHNRKVDEIYVENPRFSDNKVFEEARKYVIALWQKIVYNEYLPLILGSPLPAYKGYNASVNPGIDALFMAAAFRFGHSAINPLILRLNPDGTQHQLGHILLHDGFYNPRQVYQSGIEPILRGMMSQLSSEVDTAVIDDLRKYFSSQPYDQVAINIMRGRDVGLPTYNDARAAFGLPRATTWSDITKNKEVAGLLQTVYNNDINQVDAYAGGLAEDHVQKSVVGPLFWNSIREQFCRLRDGDRYWYENYDQSGITEDDLGDLAEASLTSLIATNAGITNGPPSALTIPSAQTFSWAGIPAPATSGVGYTLGSKQVTDGYIVNWNVTATDVTFTLQTNYTGFFGLGFSSTGMVRADIAICTPLQTTFTCQDYYATTYAPPQLDKDVGGTEDLTNVLDLTSTQTYHKRVMQFTKPRTSIDTTYDKQLTGTTIPIIFAFTDSQVLQYHGPKNRGFTTITFASASSNSSNSNDFFTDTLNSAGNAYFIFHGTIMLTCFGILAPLAIFIARHPSLFENWLQWHNELMKNVVWVAVFDVIVVTVSQTLEGYQYDLFFHARVGMTVSGLLALNFILGYLSKSIARLSMEKSRQVRKYHQILGWGIYITGQVNCILGLRDISEAVSDTHMVGSWVFLGYSVNMLAFLLYYERFLTPFLAKRVRKNKDRFRSNSIVRKRNIPKFEWDEIHYRIEKGSHWIVIKDLIFDVEDFRMFHPGGSELLQMAYGLDCEQLFNGMEAIQMLIDGHDDAGMEVKYIVPKKYVHSRLATTELNSYLIGQVANAFTSNVINNMVNSPDRWVKITLEEKTLVNSRKSSRHVYSFTFGFSDAKWAIKFQPGDAVQLRLIFAGRVITRLYTPVKVSANKLHLIIKIYNDGIFTTLLDKLPVEAELYFRGPLSMTPGVVNQDTQNGCYAKIGMVCGGTGIAPMFQALEYYLANAVIEEVDLRLVAVFDTDDDLISVDRIKEYVTKFKGQLRVHILYTKGFRQLTVRDGLITVSAGNVTKELLAKHLPKDAKIEVFQKVAKENPNDPAALVRKRVVKQSIDMLDQTAQALQRDDSVLPTTKRESPQISRKSSGTIAKPANLEPEPDMPANFKGLIHSYTFGGQEEMQEGGKRSSQLRILVSGSDQFLADIADRLYGIGYEPREVILYENHQTLFHRAPSLRSSGKKSSAQDNINDRQIERSNIMDNDGLE